MAYDYLTICQNVAQDAGISGQIESVVGLSGDQARIARYVREACLKIEQRWGDWKFMFAGIQTISLSSGLNTYTASVDVHRWNKYKMAIDGQEIPRDNVYEYHEWRGPYADPNQGTPTVVIIMPDNSLMFYPTPDGPHTFQCDTYKEPAMLSVDTDLPNVPQRHCPTIQFFALKQYALYDASEELNAMADNELLLYNTLLENDQRPSGFESDTSYGGNLSITTG